MHIPYIFSGETLTVFLKDAKKPLTIHKGDRPYNEVAKMLLEGTATESKLIVCMDKKTSILQFAGSHLYYNEMKCNFTYRGIDVTGGLIQRILYMKDNGYSFEHLMKFMNNLVENPSQDSINQLYDFLEANNLPITEDGYFLAYKKIRENYTDSHTGTYDYSIGKVVEMPREQVDSNKNIACSTGLHVAAWGYAQSFSGQRLVVIKINPRDVVSVPNDYDMEKMRVCRLEVLSEIEEEHKRIRPYFSNSDNPLIDEDEMDEWDEEEGIDYDVDRAISEEYEEEEEEEFFDRVQWTSQAGGFVTRKIGHFIHSLDAGEDVEEIIEWCEDEGYLPGPTGRYSKKNIGKSISNIDRALVLVTRIDDRGAVENLSVPRLYTPRLSMLERVN